MDFLSVFQNLTHWQIIAGLIVAVIIGIGKTGIGGIVLLAIPILASAFGAIESTGLMLTMFLIGDVFAVRAYARHGKWEEIRKLLPPALAGLALGSLVVVLDEFFSMRRNKNNPAAAEVSDSKAE